MLHRASNFRITPVLFCGREVRDEEGEEAGSRLASTEIRGKSMEIYGRSMSTNSNSMKSEGKTNRFLRKFMNFQNKS